MSEGGSPVLMPDASLPCVSIVIPLYNKEATIERAIRSVLSQTETFYELIIIDDGSTDRSLEIARRFESDRIIVKAQPNAGPGAARNRGVATASAPLIAFLDADDEWLPQHLATATAALASNPAAQAYVCGYDAGAFRNERPNKVAQLHLAGVSEVALDLDGATLKRHVDAMHSSCTVVRRTVFEAMGGFYTLDNCRYGEDSYLWLSVLFNGPICWDPREFVLFHVEDSALGFATQVRRTARPISLFGDSIRNRLPPHKCPAFDRIVQTYANMDLDALIRAGAFSAIADLRTRNGSASLRTFIRDRYRWARYHIPKLIGRS